MRTDEFDAPALDKITVEDIKNLGFVHLSNTDSYGFHTDHFQRFDSDDSDSGWMDGYRHYTEVFANLGRNEFMIRKLDVGGFTGGYEVYPVYSAVCKTLDQLKQALEETSHIGSFNYFKK